VCCSRLEPYFTYVHFLLIHCMVVCDVCNTGGPFVRPSQKLNASRPSCWLWLRKTSLTFAFYAWVTQKGRSHEWKTSATSWEFRGRISRLTTLKNEQKQRQQHLTDKEYCCGTTSAIGKQDWMDTRQSSVRKWSKVKWRLWKANTRTPYSGLARC